MKQHVLILTLLLGLLLVGGWYWQTSTTPAAQAPAATMVQLTASSSPAATEMDANSTDPYAHYEPLSPMRIGDQDVQASIAATAQERKQGLSHTPTLPADVVKLFVFPESGQWGFWMKDMNYAIDILWVDADGIVVHVESAVSPDSYPTSFTSSEPARYVIETVAGFATEHGVTTGTEVVLPEQR